MAEIDWYTGLHCLALGFLVAQLIYTRFLNSYRKMLHECRMTRDLYLKDWMDSTKKNSSKEGPDALREQKERIVDSLRKWRTQYDLPGQGGEFGALAQSCVDSAIGIVEREA